MHCPDGEYLAGLRPERLDVSDAYAASGRRIFFLMPFAHFCLRSQLPDCTPIPAASLLLRWLIHCCMDVERASRTDVTLCIQVTPPKNQRQTMLQFLSVDAVTSVKPKASLEIPSPLVKKSFVVPAILSRRETVHNYLSRNPSNQKIAVHLPGCAEPMLGKIDALQKA